jgi:hypothetical protein
MNKELNMSTYFQTTPIYKIWISLIEYILPKSTFLIGKKRMRFINVECRHEEMRISYDNDAVVINQIYNHINRTFCVEMLSKKSGKTLAWRNPPIDQISATTFEELTININQWLACIENEL